eukprot:TRINITY_DN51606_c0_g1_i1.p1 TRINITY_DN51606_c0_g1~~TRINITY_DN51606_c0_g1_i1.p1  ORF type:complete len:323 (+),score=46.64 TRINITY_DN51606_c0_g1_i1:81-1049(+)
MVYMEKLSGGKERFWDISIKGLQVVTKSGLLGSEGVNRIRQFSSEKGALQFYLEQVQQKRDSGYTQKSNKRKLEDVEGSASEQSEETRNSNSQGHSKRQALGRGKKRGLRGTVPPDTTRPIGFIDPEAQLYGHLYINNQGEMLDAMLVKNHPTQDTYYIIQLIHAEDYNQFYVYTRWGKVGTAGQCQIFYPNNKDDAIDLFEEKFFSKTGLEWEERNKYQSEDDMYQYITLQSNKSNFRKMQKFHNEEFNKAKKESKIVQTSNQKKAGYGEQDTVKIAPTVSVEKAQVSEKSKENYQENNEAQQIVGMDVDNIVKDPYELSD